MSAQRAARLRVWYRKWQDVIQVAYGVALMGLATGLGALALHVGSQSSHTAKVARASCMRSIKYGPYLAALYASDLDPRPHHVYRVMPPSAAKAYAESIPKHC